MTRYLGVLIFLVVATVGGILLAQPWSSLSRGNQPDQVSSATQDVFAAPIVESAWQHTYAPENMIRVSDSPDQSVAIVRDDATTDAVDADTGEILWSRSSSERLDWPIFTESTVLLSLRRDGGFGDVSVIDQRSGEQLWSFTNRPSIGIAHTNGMIVYSGIDVGPGTEDQFVAASDERTGDLIWRMELNAKPLDLHYSDQGIVLVRVGKGEKNEILCLKAATGETVWSHAGKRANNGLSLQVLDHSVVVHSRAREPEATNITLLDLASGEVLLDRDLTSSNGIIEGAGYMVIDQWGEGQYEILTSSGEPVWTQVEEGAPSHPILIDDMAIYSVNRSDRSGTRGINLIESRQAWFVETGQPALRPYPLDDDVILSYRADDGGYGVQSVNRRSGETNWKSTYNLDVEGAEREIPFGGFAEHVSVRGDRLFLVWMGRPVSQIVEVDPSSGAPIARMQINDQIYSYNRRFMDLPVFIGNKGIYAFQ